jgi:hypothetical protein
MLANTWRDIEYRLDICAYWHLPNM